jgi:hypothetical protein
MEEFMASKMVKCPEALYNEASKLAEERGVSIGTALELMVARGGSAPQSSPSQLDAATKKTRINAVNLR